MLGGAGITVSAMSPHPSESPQGEAPPVPARRHPTLRRKLLVILALAGAPAVLFAIADSARVHHAATAQAERDFMALALAAAQPARDALLGAQAALEAVASLPAIRAAMAPDPGAAGAIIAACDAALAAWIAASADLSLAVAIDRAGGVRCAADPGARALDFRDDPAVAAALRAQGFAATAGARRPAPDPRALALSAPIRDGDAVTGVLSLSLRPALTGAPPPDARAPPALALVDRDGAPLVGAPILAAQAFSARLTDAPQVFRTENADGAALAVAVAPLAEGHVWMLAAAPFAAAERGVILRAVWPLAAPALMWLLAIAVVYFTVDRPVSKHLERLKRVLRAYGRGRFGLRPRTPESAPREIATLAQDMGAMATRLAAREQALRRSADDNQALLLEVYHRVRNNLQTIISMLSLEARRATVPEEKATIARIQSRIQSLALVQQTLLSVDAPHTVRLDALTSAIVEHLLSGDAGLVPDDHARLGVRMRLTPALASAERAAPLALLINEAVTNALRHGTPARAQGAGPWLDIALTTQADGQLDLAIVNDAADTGAVAAPGALGMRIMQGFADQLGATLNTRRADGRSILQLTIPPEDGAAASAAPGLPTPPAHGPHST